MPQAIPGRSSSTGPEGHRLGNGGLLRVVSGADLDARAQSDHDDAEAARARQDLPTNLSSFIRTQWTIFRNNRNQGEGPLNDRLLRAQRMFDGRYDPDKLRAIKQFGGSEVYSRLVAVKARGATSLLRDVYLGPDRPWDIAPQPDPPVPPDIKATIMQLVSHETQGAQQAAQQQAAQAAQSGSPPPPPPSPQQAQMRIMDLLHAAQQVERRNAIQQTSNATDAIEDILVAGRFYESLAAFLVDLPLFPFACIKGPTVRMVTKLTWSQGKPKVRRVPQMFWERVSPFDIYWTSGVSNIADAAVIERRRVSRTDLNDLLGLPGYDEAAIRGALVDYARGYRDWMDSTDSEQALNEGREDPNFNQSQLIDMLEYTGQVQGHMLIDAGMDPSMIPDPDLDYMVQSWVVGNYVLKTQLAPSPRQRHNYYITSFEKVPGTVSGHSLPDLLEDIQEASNAVYRALVNNLSMASGPQAVVNTDAIAPDENPDEMYPWKVWKTTSDPMSNGARPPVEFFQPQSNAQELMAVLGQLSSMADETSAIPRYITGSQQGLGGAGRTASGLSMLMGNAEKVLQTVAANVDGDIMEPLLLALYDMIMLTDQSGMLTGQEEIRVRGVNVAVQKETERQKQLQFLQITANPIDAPIIGELGRARLLRAVGQNMGLPDDIVPSDDTIQQQMQAQKIQQAAQQAMQQANAGQPPGQAPNQQSGTPGAAGAPGAQAQGAQAPAAPPAQHADNAPPINLQQQGLPA